MLHYLRHSKRRFKWCCVDIWKSERLAIMLHYMDFVEGQGVEFHVQNSLEFLWETDEKFDLVFLDGDHNYHTVSKELEMLPDCMTETGIIIVDDYHGRWSEKDLWYAERDSHSDPGVQARATQRAETDKHGVRPAVDEFLKANPEWTGVVPMIGEPILLVRKDPPDD